MLPLVFVLGMMVSLSAPAAYFFLQWRALRQQGQMFATRIASFVRREAHQQPLLWQYDTTKILQHFKTYYAPKSLYCLEVWGHSRRILKHCTVSTTTHSANPRHLLWETHPIRQGLHHRGNVWVAVSTYSLKVHTLFLLFGFSVLGMGLGWFLFRIPSRTVGQAETQMLELLEQLSQTQIELSSLNEDLEQQVQDRTAALHQAYAQVQLKESRLRELSNKALMLQEEERRAISRELHDAVGQSLTAIRLQLQLLCQLISAPESVQKLTTQTLSMVDHTIDEVRRAVQRLGPTVVQEYGLIRALQQLCETFTEQTQIQSNWEHHVSPQATTVPLRVENALYRMAQESLHNVAKHARATQIWVQIHHNPSQITLHIQDNGCGFPCLSSTTGHGIQGIRERCELLGGSFSITTPAPTDTTIQSPAPPQLGTLLLIELPLDTMQYTESDVPS